MVELTSKLQDKFLHAGSCQNNVGLAIVSNSQNQFFWKSWLHSGVPTIPKKVMSTTPKKKVCQTSPGVQSTNPTDFVQHFAKYNWNY